MITAIGFFVCVLLIACIAAFGICAIAAAMLSSDASQELERRKEDLDA